MSQKTGYPRCHAIYQSQRKRSSPDCLKHLHSLRTRKSGELQHLQLPPWRHEMGQWRPRQQGCLTEVKNETPTDVSDYPLGRNRKAMTIWPNPLENIYLSAMFLLNSENTLSYMDANLYNSVLQTPGPSDAPCSGKKFRVTRCIEALFEHIFCSSFAKRRLVS